MGAEPSLPDLSWSAADIADSLKAVHRYVEAEAARQIQWYQDKRTWKARMSSGLRVVSILSFTIGGLVPIIKAALPANVP